MSWRLYNWVLFFNVMVICSLCGCYPSPKSSLNQTPIQYEIDSDGNVIAKNASSEPNLSGEVQRVQDDEKTRQARLDLQRVIDRAQEALTRFRLEVRDYTALMTKRERVYGALKEAQVMEIKIRCRDYSIDEKKAESKAAFMLRPASSSVKVPLHVYMRFIEPSSIAGREVIWVEGKNSNQMIAHEVGLLNLMSLHLDPTGSLAMQGNKYPITEIGIENLLIKLVEKGRIELGRKRPPSVTFSEESVDDNLCDVINLEHAAHSDEQDFRRVKIWISKEIECPIKYMSWSWKNEKNGQPQIDEEYAYSQLKENVSLSNDTFDSNNPSYDFP